jgi:hypothetical protein
MDTWLRAGGIITGIIGAYLIIVTGLIMKGAVLLFCAVLLFVSGGGQKYNE